MRTLPLPSAGFPVAARLVEFLGLRGAGSDSAGSRVRLPASRTPALGPRCVQVLTRPPEALYSSLPFFAVTGSHMLTAHPCVLACLPLPAGDPSDRKVACGSGDVAAPHRGSLSPAGFLVDPGEDLLLSGVPTEPTGGRGGTAGPCHGSCQLWAERRVGSWAGGGVRAAVAPPGAPSDLQCPRLQTQLIQMVVWMLQRRLLVQLHTYVCLMASPSEDEPRAREDDAPLATRVGGRSLSTPNALSFGSPSRASCPWASVWGGGGEHLGALGRGGWLGGPTWAPASEQGTVTGLHSSPCSHSPHWAALPGGREVLPCFPEDGALPC